MLELPGPSRDLAALYRVTARLHSAGIPPIQMAAALRADAAGSGARRAAAALAGAFATSALPSEALRGAGLPPAHVAVVRAGETTGRLDLVLDRLAEACEARARVLAEMWHLAIEPIVAWLVIAFILPLAVLVTSGVGPYLRAALPIALVPPIVVAILRRSAASGFAPPGLAEVMRLHAAARACRTIALLSGAGIPMPATLRDAADAAAHQGLTGALRRAADNLERGAGLADALRRAQVLRPVEMALVADAEITGRLDVAFERAAGLLEHEALAKTRWRLRVMAATLFAIVAVYAAMRLAGAIARPLPELP